MLTLFATTKPFVGPIATIQRNALRSWQALSPSCQIILFGDEAGTAAIATELGIEHVPEVARNEFGTPLLDGIFSTAEQLARHPLLCYANADLLFLSDWPTALARVQDWRPRGLAVGECWNLDVPDELCWSPQTEPELRERLRGQGRRRGRSALDFFVFPRGFYRQAPPLALGRGGFDNWLIWDARRRGEPVVDLTDEATVIHQNHDYGHVAGGKPAAHRGPEAVQNRALAGGWRHIYTLDDATHRLRGNQLRPHWGRWGRLAHRWTRLKLRLGGAIRA